MAENKMVIFYIITSFTTNKNYNLDVKYPLYFVFLNLPKYIEHIHTEKNNNGF